MKIVTIHGIRRDNRWYEEIPNMEVINELNIDVLYFDYGFFSFFKFLTKKQRNKIINNFSQFYSDNFKGENTILPSIIAHSFGTYVVFQAMKKYDVIKFDKIIFCGSILNSKLDFRDLIAKQQFKQLKNDHGKLEWFLKYTRYIIDKDCGKAGKVGFLDIPLDKKNMIINSESYKSHSEYFLPINMEKNWIPFLIEDIQKFEYNKEILKDLIIDRIYDNISSTNELLEINNIKFFSRVDKKGNYFAKYVKDGLNKKTKPIDEVYFTTTADGIQNAENMNFICYDSNNSKLNTEIVNDYNNKKKFKIILDNPLKMLENIELRYYFCWYNTMNLRTGDTDHWSFSGVKNVEITVNFPYVLKTPKIFIIKNKRIVEEHRLNSKTESDNTVSYNFKYDNIKNNDGAIFYYEGFVLNKKIVYTKNKEIELTIGDKKEIFVIAKASESDIKKVYDIELEIEHSNAASEETLNNRMFMFNEGFIIIKNKKNNNVVGYIESFIWNEKEFETFDEISNFPLNFNINGNTLYIIFVAVDKDYRKMGLATKLLNEVDLLAKKHNVKKVQLVAKDQLMNFYAKFGYKEIKELPQFLKDKDYKSVLMEK
ncbi:GNAT family N-acetyltransferase [Flavobacterium sp.]|uniref:GNAT family N-acetyltransferase n=1 Tax=Flavobacterium sp. TaxID=239 RepID=UPI002B4B2F0A|nr:GNAT family N-acetyltransferase [Flavobacterium sp.]HLP63454.1 GNAT family N-acetyltransferase [Flavobacterium sp.]